MARRSVLLAIVIVLIGFGVYWVLTTPQTVAADALPPRSPDLANGQAAFNAGGCASCHATPGQPDRTRLGGGLAVPSPFGTFHVPNISPDSTDGIGAWSERDFVNAVLKGTSPSGAHYYPSFPYASYQLAKLDDVRDLFAYLKTLPKVSGEAPAHMLPFPFDIRRNVGIWKALFLDVEPVAPDPAQSSAWNRGAYLVNGLGHCAECHSPRNALGGIVASQRFAGGPNPEGEGWVPNITQKGLADWSDSDIAYFLETGQLPNGDSTGGAMVRVIRNISQLSADDRKAMAVYLKSLPPVEGPPKPPKKIKS